jgi:galactose mutarotase-like enzyme
MVAIEQRQYKTYILSEPTTGAIAEVVPERGGIVTSWKVQGQEIFYLDTERFTSPELSVRGGIPVLFPICGNLPDNTYIHNGQSYSLKQHGFAREMPWEVVSDTSDDRPSITLALSSSDHTRAVYPFEFRLEFTYSLQGNSLIAQQRFTNAASEVMPFSAGFHPYFLVLNKSQMQVNIPGTEYQDNVSKAVIPYSGQFDWQQDEIDAAFRQLSAQTASVQDSDRGLKLTLHSSKEFSTLVFWTVKGKDFYCLEPWTAPRNALNTGEHLLQLEPGASLETSFELVVEFGS